MLQLCRRTIDRRRALGGSVAATVNGQAIPMVRFKDLVNAVYQSSLQSGQPATPQAAAHRAIGQLIEGQIMIEEAQKHGITASSAAVEREIKKQIKAAR